MYGEIAFMTKPGELTFKKYPLPEVKDGDVLAEVIRTNICGSELHTWKGDHPTRKSGTLGHEMVGNIYKLGKDVKTDTYGTPIKEGDRISAVYFYTCGSCFYCSNNQQAQCQNAHQFYLKSPDEAPHFHKTFGTHYYIHEGQHFYKVPDNVPDSVASGANCALSQVYFGLEKAKIKYGDYLVIQGAGGLGLNATAIAKEMGVKTIVIDGVTSRLEMATKFGADYIIDMNEFKTLEERVEQVNKITEGRGADVTIELAGVPVAFQEGVYLTRIGGKYVTIGNLTPGLYLQFDPGYLTRKALTILAINRYDPIYLHKSLQFLSKNIDKYPFEEVVSTTFSFYELKKALNKSVSREVTRASIVF